MAGILNHNKGIWRQQEGPCHDLLPRVPATTLSPDLAEEARQCRDTNLEMEDCAK